MFCIRLIGLVIIASLLAAGEQPLGEAGDILLRDFHPVSIYKTPQTAVTRAKYPAVDFHAHDYAKTDADVDKWIRMMDEANIAKTIILASCVGEKFTAMAAKYGRYPDRFEMWCEFDYDGYDQPGWAERALVELERCHQIGAKGIGEVMDKGLGFAFRGMHINDPRMKPLLEKCAQLHMPVSIHVAEDAWMYQKPDVSNDGLMNAAKWRVDLTKPGILDHDQLIGTLEEAVKDNPKTTFVACHLANCCSDLSQLGRLFDAYPNLYADFAARYGEIAPIPRMVHAFMEKYRERLVYGTDMNFVNGLYPVSFRILETADEHFYENARFHYHWPLYGLELGDATLKQIYSLNSVAIHGR